MFDELEFIHIEELSNGFLVTIGQAENVKVEKQCETATFCKDQNAIISLLEKHLENLKKLLSEMNVK